MYFCSISQLCSLFATELTWPTFHTLKILQRLCNSPWASSHVHPLHLACSDPFSYCSQQIPRREKIYFTISFCTLTKKSEKGLKHKYTLKFTNVWEMKKISFYPWFSENANYSHMNNKMAWMCYGSHLGQNKWKHPILKKTITQTPLYLLFSYH